MTRTVTLLSHILVGAAVFEVACCVLRLRRQPSHADWLLRHLLSVIVRCWHRLQALVAVQQYVIGPPRRRRGRYPWPAAAAVVHCPWACVEKTCCLRISGACHTHTVLCITGYRAPRQGRCRRGTIISLVHLRNETETFSNRQQRLTVLTYLPPFSFQN